MKNKNKKMSHYFLFCSCESSSSMEISKDIYSTKTMVQKNTKSDLSRVFYLINWGFDYRQISFWTKFLITKKYFQNKKIWNKSYSLIFKMLLSIISTVFKGCVCYIFASLFCKRALVKQGKMFSSSLQKLFPFLG